MPEIKRPAQTKRQAEQPKPQVQERRNLLDRALDAMEGVVTTDKEKSLAPSGEKDETQVKRKIGYLYAGIVAVALILALILRGLIH